MRVGQLGQNLRWSGAGIGAVSVGLRPFLAILRPWKDPMPDGHMHFRPDLWVTHG